MRMIGPVMLALVYAEALRHTVLLVQFLDVKHVLAWLNNVVVELIPPGQSGQSGSWDVRQRVKVQSPYRSYCRQQERQNRGGLYDLDDRESHVENLLGLRKPSLCVFLLSLNPRCLCFVGGRNKVQSRAFRPSLSITIGKTHGNIVAILFCATRNKEH